MNIKDSLIKAFICLGLISIMFVAVLGDTIRLKDGSVLKGKVVSYSQGNFTIIVYIGGTTSQHIIPVDAVDSIEFDSSTVTASAGDVQVQPVERIERSVPVTEPEPAATQPEPVANPPRTDTSERISPEVDSGLIPVIAEKTVSVAAAADWTSTEIRVQKGQRIVINASGEVDLGDNRRVSPDGQNITDVRKLIPNKPTGSLIAVVGDDNDDFIFVGGSSEFISPHNGILFLSVNEGNLRDNNGAFVARVKVLSNR